MSLFAPLFNLKAFVFSIIFLSKAHHQWRKKASPTSHSLSLMPFGPSTLNPSSVFSISSTMCTNAIGSRAPGGRYSMGIAKTVISLVRNDGQGNMSKTGWCDMHFCASVGCKLGGSRAACGGSKVQRLLMSHSSWSQPSIWAIVMPTRSIFMYGISSIMSAAGSFLSSCWPLI